MLRIGKELFDIFYPVGSYYETSNVNFNPNTNPNWFGEWTEDTEGQTLVSRNSGTFKNVGDVIGEEKHQLTIEEMPNHGHYSGDESNGFFAHATGGGGWHVGFSNTLGEMGWYRQPNNIGGNKPHNNIQPSKVCVRWHRIA